MSTIQKVNSVLRKAGFTISKWEKSKQIRGWGSRNTGCKVQKIDHVPEAFCEVEHYEERRLPEAERDARYAAKTEAYNAALAAAGLKTRIDGHTILVLK